ncbi:hypothetical protein FA09DRAFT_201045 [Tilletiopsis washingtonensis]|uniref:Ig-like domain-containing protein n=1 Tax=Tilletiopsis washingtonensis TaxID=58919 RepID=A0A316ZI81_9BASI|nr:hypothetical protein FA09DRAFT_201045 [Tilletiopsis washingtonensis]PWN99983.1 hypothetical protein FA09DRAFT_201045 [Tilletiopsis washingtonensis]
MATRDITTHTRRGLLSALLSVLGGAKPAPWPCARPRLPPPPVAVYTRSTPACSLGDSGGVPYLLSAPLYRAWRSMGRRCSHASRPSIELLLAPCLFACGRDVPDTSRRNGTTWPSLESAEECQIEHGPTMHRARAAVRRQSHGGRPSTARHAGEPCEAAASAKAEAERSAARRTAPSCAVAFSVERPSCQSRTSLLGTLLGRGHRSRSGIAAGSCRPLPASAAARGSLSAVRDLPNGRRGRPEASHTSRGRHEHDAASASAALRFLTQERETARRRQPFRLRSCSVALDAPFGQRTSSPLARRSSGSVQERCGEAH